MRVSTEEIVKIDIASLIEDQLTTDDFVHMLEENDFETDIVVRIQIISDLNKEKTDSFCVPTMQDNRFLSEEDEVYRIPYRDMFTIEHYQTSVIKVVLTKEYVLSKVNSEYRHTKNKYEDIRDRYYQLNQEVEDMKQELNMLRAFKDTYK